MNSTAVTVELVRRGEPITVNLFGDTGGEKPETYAFLSVFHKWLTKKGYPGITRVQRTNQYGTAITLEAECHRTKDLPSIVFGGKTCSDKFKVQPSQKFMNSFPDAREAWAREEKVIKIIGYHRGEQRRADRALDNLRHPKTEAAERELEKYELRFPLIEWGWDHDECVEAIKATGLPVPPKSACFFCPSTKKPEIVQLRRRHPDLYERALALEDRARPNLTNVAGLGRRFSWRDVDAPGLDTPVNEPCECWDGECGVEDEEGDDVALRNVEIVGAVPRAADQAHALPNVRRSP
ncbi:MAG: phosphoadenosine phosphosulfate reductase [Labilithrix sp.]|nr:phosphoadenosine phosphosulfate reductase [Labilithrix sp.]